MNMQVRGSGDESRGHEGTARSSMAQGRQACSLRRCCFRSPGGWSSAMDASTTSSHTARKPKAEMVPPSGALLVRKTCTGKSVQRQVLRHDHSRQDEATVRGGVKANHA